MTEAGQNKFGTCYNIGEFHQLLLKMSVISKYTKRWRGSEKTIKLCFEYFYDRNQLS
jgi:hypothetical protein